MTAQLSLSWLTGKWQNLTSKISSELTDFAYNSFCKNLQRFFEDEAAPKKPLRQKELPEEFKLSPCTFERLMLSASGKQLRHFKNGQTVTSGDENVSTVIEGVNLIYPAFAKILDFVMQLTQRTCHANLYYTPPFSRGFSVHTDGHDVFVVHLFGTKYWCLYDKNPVFHDNGYPMLVKMEKGTLLQISQGTPHGAITRSEASIHLTIGVSVEG